MIASRQSERPAEWLDSVCLDALAGEMLDGANYKRPNCYAKKQ